MQRWMGRAGTAQRSAKHRLYPAQHLHIAEGLDDIIVGPLFKKSGYLHIPVLGRKNDYRYVGEAPESPQHLESIHIR